MPIMFTYFYYYFCIVRRQKNCLIKFLSIMVTRFLIFCEPVSDSGKSVRYLNEIISDSEGLQELLVHLYFIGVKVFKVVPIVVDVDNGLIKCCL